MPKVFAPAPFRYPPQTGKDYPYGWQDIPDDSLARTLAAAGLIDMDLPEAGALSLDEHANEHAAMGVKTDYAMATPRFSGAQKPFGVVINNTFINVSSGLSTSDYGQRYKFDAEAPFDGIQLVVVNRAANAVNNITALVAVTETAGWANANEISQPIVGGTARATVVGSGNLGHRAVTWSSAGSVSLGAATTAMQVAVSDMVDIDYVERTDGGTRPLALISAQHAAADGSYAFIGTGYFGYNRVANSGNKGRILQSCAVAAAVATPTNTATVMNNSGLEIFPVFRYLVPSITVMVVGDSTEQGLESPAAIASWGFMGCADASTPIRPVNYINAGCSGRNSDEYWLRAKEILAAGVVVDVLVIGPISVNDDYKTSYSTKLAAMRKRRTDILRTAKQYGVKRVLFIPLKPHNVNTAADDANRLALNAENRAVAAVIPGCAMLNFDALGDGATPERWRPEYNAVTSTYGILLNLPKVATDATGYVAGTTYTATVTIGATACPISFVGSAAPTFGALIDVLNAQINAGMGTSGIVYASLYGGTVFIQAAVAGTGNTVVITAGTAFAAPLANFVAVTTSLQMQSSADGLHPNHRAAMEVMAPALTRYLQSI